MNKYPAIASSLLLLTGLAGQVSADEVPSTHKGKTLGELGKIISIQEFSYRDRVNKAFKTPGYKDEGLRGLPPEFLASHLFTLSMIPHGELKNGEHQISMAIMFEPSFEVRYLDGSLATVYPNRVDFRMARGKTFSCWLYKLPNKMAEQAGAGEPATRPESEAEGGDKPQPEAEGRSR